MANIPIVATPALAAALVLAAGLSTGPALAVCGSQTATGQGAVCGVTYGGTIQYCYANSANWWFVESVAGTPNTCQAGVIGQTSNPIQSASGCVSDTITNGNGPPAGVAPCTDITNQAVSFGPTQLTVTQCSQANTQTITVNSPPTRTVVTASGGATVSCNY